MKYLLDTHVFVWLDNDTDKLSEKFVELFGRDEHQFMVSVASIWEMQIKLQLGKLELRASLEETITTQQSTNDIEILPIEVPHVLALEKLPFHHKDPFDRLLVAQAQVEGAYLISNDPQIGKYAVTVVW